MCTYSIYQMCVIGFQSPAADYVEKRLSLDERLIHKPSSTYYMKESETIYRCGIMKDALLVIDWSHNPCDGSLLACDVEGEDIPHTSSESN
ncbi:DNA polymerase V [Escherichia coli]